MMGGLFRRAALGLAVALAAACPNGSRAQDGGTLILASTTSVDNSGLLGAILPRFTATTGIAVRVLALGTGQALAVTARGDADLVLVHDPEAEQRFVADGHGADRRPVAWNDFIIVGPAEDPARVREERDAPAGLRRIAAAQAPFVSRGDNSGTHALERRLWREAAVDPATGSGRWYRDIGGGMGAALNAAAGMGAYTLSDRGTWLSFNNKAGLRVVLEGGRALLNPYSVIVPNPANRRPEAMDGARRLADWLTGAEGQAEIAAFTVAGQRLFNPLSVPMPE